MKALNRIVVDSIFDLRTMQTRDKIFALKVTYFAEMNQELDQKVFVFIRPLGEK